MDSRRSLRVEVVVEVPKWGFVKRSGKGRVEFISPFPCPFNYGSVQAFTGGDGDPLDAALLGGRISRGGRVRASVRGAVGFTDRGIQDDKLICGPKPVRAPARAAILLFFQFYAACKRLQNTWLGQRGRTACEGWLPAETALARARPRDARLSGGIGVSVRKNENEHSHINGSVQISGLRPAEKTVHRQEVEQK